MDDSRLTPTQTGGDVSGHSEERILIDGARDQALIVALATKNLGEGGRERRRCLDSRIGIFADVVRISKAKNGLHLTGSNTFLDPHDVWIHGAVNPERRDNVSRSKHGIS